MHLTALNVLSAYTDCTLSRSGDGLVDKKEFRLAVAAIGMSEAPKAEVDALFDSFDGDRSGTVDYHELNRVCMHELCRSTLP